MAEKPEELCITRIAEDAGEETPFPGRMPKDELRVCVREEAHEAMRKHALSSLEAEVCGVMLGKLCHDKSGPYLQIEHAIKGEAARSESARVTFTPETWNAIHAEQENYEDELSMVGWYHTHPRFGIFLSEYDRFIHRNFFGVESWMVAFVIDPVKDEEGFFGWHRGEIRRFQRHWIGTQPRRSDGAEFDGREIKDDDAAPAAPAATEAVLAPAAGEPVAPMIVDEAPAPEDSQFWLVASVTAVLIVLVLSSAWNQSALDSKLRQQRRLSTEVFLYSSELAFALAEMRRDLGLKPSARLSELNRRSRELAERNRSLQEAASGGVDTEDGKVNPADGGGTGGDPVKPPPTKDETPDKARSGGSSSERSEGG